MKLLVTTWLQHVDNCGLCKGKGFICELCERVSTFSRLLFSLFYLPLVLPNLFYTCFIATVNYRSVRGLYFLVVVFVRSIFFIIQEDVIYPFLLDKTIQCQMCWACYHQQCWSGTCPKCARIRSRKTVG